MRNLVNWAVMQGRYFSNRREPFMPASDTLRTLASGLALLSGLCFANGVTHAAELKAGDVLVTDVSANTLIVVDRHSGKRTVLSDFYDAAQGPVLTGQATFSGVAVRHGRIFVTAGTRGIFLVDPRTGQRKLVSDFSRGAYRGGFVGFGVAVDSFGEVVTALHQGFPTSVLRVAPWNDTRTIVSDLSNASQGGDLSCCSITDLTLEPRARDENHDGREAILIDTADIPNLDPQRESAIYRVDPVTGHRSLVSDFTNPAQGLTGVDPNVGLAVEPDGAILVDTMGSQGDLLVRVDPKTGNRTVVSNFDDPAEGPVGNYLWGAAVVGPRHAVVAAVNPNTLGISLYCVDLRTGHRGLFSDSGNPKQGPAFRNPNYIAVIPAHAGFDALPAADSLASPFGAPQ